MLYCIVHGVCKVPRIPSQLLLIQGSVFEAVLKSTHSACSGQIDALSAEPLRQLSWLCILMFE